MFILKYLYSWAVLTIALLLTACNDKPMIDESSLQVQRYGDEYQKHQQNNTLSQVAGHSGIALKEEPHVHFPLSETAKPYIGRYMVRVDCLDQFAHCSRGQADFILTLLEDGTARRSIVHTGNVSFDHKWKYWQDSWFYDEAHHQIVLHRENGVEFFYNITDERNLVMDLEKIMNGTELNRAYFAAGNPMPGKAYKLKKVS